MQLSEILKLLARPLINCLKINPSIPISNARRIVDARNKIIHGYDSVEPVNIWAIVINHLPTLKLEITDLLNE